MLENTALHTVLCLLPSAPDGLVRSLVLSLQMLKQWLTAFVRKNEGVMIFFLLVMLKPPHCDPLCHNYVKFDLKDQTHCDHQRGSIFSNKAAFPS